MCSQAKTAETMETATTLGVSMPVAAGGSGGGSGAATRTGFALSAPDGIIPIIIKLDRSCRVLASRRHEISQ